MKNDARIRYTKMVIKDSFFQLLKQKPVEKITVKEICEMAQINRATFYRYYENQYDLLSVIENDMFQNIQDTIKEQTADLNSLIKEILNSLYKIKTETMGTLNGQPCRSSYRFQNIQFLLQPF